MKKINAVAALLTNNVEKDKILEVNKLGEEKSMQTEKWKWLPIDRFLKKNTAVWIVTGFFLLITYGIKVFNVSISHDTEAIMAVPESLYSSWYSMGRFGLMAIKKVLGTYVFNPYAASFLMLVVIFLNAMLWTWLFSWIGGKDWQNKHTNWVFPVVFFTSVISAEQNGFLLQSYEVNVALLLLGLSLIFAFKWILEKKGFLSIFLLAAILCGAAAFSVYQTLVPLFTAAVAFCFLLIYDASAKREGNASAKFCFLVIGKMIMIFLVAFIIYSLVNRCILAVLQMETTPYISDQIMWGKISLEQGIENIRLHIYKVFTGNGIFYSRSFLLAYVGMILYAVVSLLKKTTCRWLYILAMLFLLASPFFMTVLMGAEPNKRSQLLLPFVVGVGFQYLVNAITNIPIPRLKSKYMFVVVSGVVGLLCLHQSMDSARLYYTQYVQYEEDVRVAEKISTQIEQLNLGEIPSEPVVFVGGRAPKKNQSCYQGSELELIGRSFFEVSYGTVHGSWVMNHFMETLGYPYMMPGEEDCKKAEQIAENMPSWPNEGSIIEQDGIIIVKLG